MTTMIFRAGIRADFVYDENGMGYGSSHDGIILVLNAIQATELSARPGSGILSLPIRTQVGNILWKMSQRDLRRSLLQRFQVTAAKICEDFLIQAAKGETGRDVGNMPDNHIDIVIRASDRGHAASEQKDALSVRVAG